MSDLTRLVTGYYNSRSVSVSNPGGMGNDGQETNFPLALQDVGTVAQTVGVNATNVATNTANAAASAAAAAALAAGIAGTSISAVAIGTGSITLQSQLSKQWQPGMFVIAVDHASPTTRWMTGYLTAYDGVTTGNVTFTVGDANSTKGSGTPAQYDIFLSGPVGAQGSQGATGGGISEDITFDTATANANPGAGKVRLNNATQNAATAIYISTTDVNGVDITAALDTLDASSSTIKGQYRLVKKSDGTKWIAGNLTARITHTGYREFTITVISSSAASPLTNADELILLFTRTGDMGNAVPPTVPLTTGGNALLAATSYGGDTTNGPISNALPVSGTNNDTIVFEDETGMCGLSPATFTGSIIKPDGTTDTSFVANVKGIKATFRWRNTGWRVSI